jgi:hypothetical protein
VCKELALDTAAVVSGLVTVLQQQRQQQQQQQQVLDAPGVTCRSTALVVGSTAACCNFYM